MVGYVPVVEEHDGGVVISQGDSFLDVFPPDSYMN
jgi:hypothetical protein